MCGRFFQIKPPATLQEWLGTVGPLPNQPERYNAAPTDPMLVVRRNPETGLRALDPLRWGLVPIWAEDRSVGARMINARAEGIEQKPSFRDAFARRRCLIPADGFFEWQREGKDKLAFAIAMADRASFTFAGLWERWRSPEGEIWRSFTVITTEANPLLAPIHARMPVILDPGDHAAWLGETPAEVPELLALLKPYPAERMTTFRVGPLVNSVRNDGPELIEPLAEVA